MNEFPIFSNARHGGSFTNCITKSFVIESWPDIQNTITSTKTWLMKNMIMIWWTFNSVLFCFWKQTSGNDRNLNIHVFCFKNYVQYFSVLTVRQWCLTGKFVFITGDSRAAHNLKDLRLPKPWGWWVFLGVIKKKKLENGKNNIFVLILSVTLKKDSLEKKVSFSNVFLGFGAQVVKSRRLTRWCFSSEY